MSDVKPMAFGDAKNTVIRFGKQYKFMTIDKIAESDAGLLWLDWLRGQDWVYAPLSTALEVYLTDKGIAADLKKLVDRKKSIGTTWAQNEHARNNGY